MVHRRVINNTSKKIDNIVQTTSTKPLHKCVKNITKG